MMDMGRVAVVGIMFGVGLVLLVGVLVFVIVTALERLMLRVIERTQRVLTTGYAMPPEAVITREENPEARAAAHFSEESIQKGMQSLRDTVYAHSGLAMPGEEELRAEALSMLAGMVPEPANVLGVRVR
jgi:hypothetical protein